MTITQIRYFLETADCASIQKASERIYISHQALSKQIKSLENELGVSLFHREKRGFQLTEAGSILYSVWSNLIQKHDSAVALASQLQSRVTVGIQDLKNTRYSCLELFRRYSVDHPAIKFDYHIKSPDQVLSMLENGQIDLAFIFTLSIEHLEKYPHLSLLQSDDQPFIVVSKENPLAKREVLSPKELERETFILIDSTYSQTVAKRQRRDFEANGISPNVLTVSNPQELELALVLNHGVGLVHKIVVMDIMDKLVFFPFEPAPENRGLGTVLLWRDKKRETMALELQKAAQSDPPLFCGN